jgi:ABC-type multidrug transport system fused ATPase/permease subunit
VKLVILIYSLRVKIKLERGLPHVLFRQFLAFGPYYLGAFLCLFLTHYVGSYLPFYAKELADLVSLGTEDIQTSKYFLLALGIILFRTSSRLLFFYPARVLERDLRTEVLARLESTNPRRYEKYPKGQLFQVLYTDIEQIRALVGFALLQIGNIFMAMMVLVPKLAEFNSGLLIALLPMVGASLLFAFLVGGTRHFHRKSADMQGEVQNIIMESYTGKKTIKNYHAEKSFVDFFRKKSLSELNYSFKAGVAVSFSVPLIPLGLGASFLWGSYIIHAEGLGASSLVLFSGFIFLFLEPLMFLSWIGVVFTASYAAWGRIRELVVDLDLPSEIEQKLIELNNDISEKDKLNLVIPFWEQNLKLEILKGSWTVFIGKTGCGKTELLYKISEVLKNEKQKIALVGQTPYIYNDTLEKNLFLGQVINKESKNKAIELLNVFGLSFLASNPNELLKLDVGENGKRLSGGQQKRLGLVRSLMSDSDILIWDDPFSSVDVILEREIIEKLRGAKHLLDKTIILSSHRVSTVKMSDYIIFLEPNTGILEKGTVNTLLKEGAGLTYDYFKKQLV